MIFKLGIEYRCGANYKTPFTHFVDSEEHPEILEIEEGEVIEHEINMGELGTLPAKKFFNSTIHPHEFDGEYDHHTLEIQSLSEFRQVEIIDGEMFGTFSALECALGREPTELELRKLNTMGIVDGESTVNEYLKKIASN